MTAGKNNWSNAFRSCFGAPACCIPPNGYVNFVTRLLQVPL